jgi:sec-independent protein translocase protein TatC
MTETYLFLVPALQKNEKRLVFGSFVAFLALFIIGSLLLYCGILPNAVKFLIKHTNSSLLPIEMHLKIEDYIIFVLRMCLCFGLSFQLPLVLVLLAIAGLIKSSHLRKFRRFGIVLIFFIAAIATPPDVPSQVILGSIMMIFYEITIIIISLIERKANQTEDETLAREST